MNTNKEKASRNCATPLILKTILPKTSELIESAMRVCFQVLSIILVPFLEVYRLKIEQPWKTHTSATRIADTTLPMSCSRPGPRKVILPPQPPAALTHNLAAVLPQSTTLHLIWALLFVQVPFCLSYLPKNELPK